MLNLCFGFFFKKSFFVFVELVKHVKSVFSITTYFFAQNVYIENNQTWFLKP